MDASTTNPVLFLGLVCGAIFAVILIACVVWAMISRNGRNHEQYR